MQSFTLPDSTWEKIKPLLGEQPKNMRGGRPRMDDRACLARNHSCVADRSALAAAAAGHELWLRHDLLAAPTRLAAG